MNATRAPDVAHLHAFFSQDPPNKQLAVAARRVFLAAHQRDPKPPRSVAHPAEPFSEYVGLRDPPIVHPAVLVVEFVSLRPASKLPTEKEVLHAATVQGSLNLTSVEMRRVPGRRIRPDVHEDVYLLLF